MSIKTLEAKIEKYAQVAEKDVEQVIAEVVAFVEGKHAEATAPKTSASTATGVGSVPAGQVAANAAAATKTA